MLITEMPASVVPISSGLFRAPPRNVIVLPVLFEGQVKAVIELASLGAFTDLQLSFLEQLTTSIGIVLNSIEATMQTEGLLKQSQQLATELQTQQRELQQTNEQLEQKAQQLADRNVEVEAKNQEIEQARRAVEEKATELALTSKYKSEFLANMSHELRTPLNSILILGQQLTENPDGNLSGKQVEFARTIHGAGTDLLNLISDILDLSKIESGTVSVDAEEVYFSNLLEMIARPFRHEAENRRLQFEVAISPNLERSIITDSKRLQQVLKNLLSNAFKFTAEGGVKLSVSPVGERLERRSSDAAARARRWWPSRCRIPASASRRRSSASSSKPFSRPMPAPAASTAAPGLGLAISRELANLLGGEIQLRSTPGVGQRVYAVPAAHLSGQRVAAKCRRAAETRAAGAAAAQRRSARRSGRSSRSSTTATRSTPDDSVVLIVEDDPHYARIMMGAGQGRGIQGAGRAPRRRCARAGARAPSDRHLARYLPARHARLDGVEPAQAGSDDAAHSRADRHAGRGSPSRPGARRVFVRAKADHHGGLGGRLRAHQGLRELRAASVCCWSRTTKPSARASRNC